MSRISESIFGALGAIRFKNRVNFMTPKRSEKYKIPTMSTKKYMTTTLFVKKRPVCTIEPVDAEAKVHIVYFHGGGYSMEASGLHFQLMKNLVKQTGCALTYIDYPLAPEHTVTDAMDMSLLAYNKLKAGYPKHRFILMGDSAGGGLALALAMRIRDEGIAGPEQIIVFSPWLDIALTNKRIPEYEKRDVILDVAALREIGEQYRGDVPADHYTVSPKYGNLSGLGAISVFYGTEEIFFPDCEEFCDEKQNGGFAVTGYEYENMQHDWVILPIEEAKRAVGEICALVALRDMTM
jgi:epsilon-lactone hydrolase